MIQPRIPSCRAAAVLLALAIHVPAARAAADDVAAPDPAVVRMLGASASARSVATLSSMLRLPPTPQEAARGRVGPPLFRALAPTADGARFEGSGLTVELVVVDYPRVRIEDARVSLTPSADGRSCAFELAGSPLGAGSSVRVTGVVEWGSGPFGGDHVTVEYSLGGATLAALRDALPGRIDASFGGVATASGKADGVVGEVTTEDAPATPLRGNLDVAMDWTVLGRTAPVAFATSWSLDDRSVRIREGHMKWQGFDLALRGWFDPRTNGRFEIFGDFAGVDAHAVAVDWDVPEAWRPVATLSGRVALTGSVGEGQLRYDATAPSISIPGVYGQSLEATDARLQGSILSINTDISCSVRATKIRIGDIELPGIPLGVMWWRGKLIATTSNTRLWGGDNDCTLGWEPAHRPKVSLSGRLANGDTKEILAHVAPWLHLDAEGAGSVAYAIGIDEGGQSYWRAHASLVAGRLGNLDLFASTVALLGAADPALKLPDAASLVPLRARLPGPGMRADRLYFQMERKPPGYAVGGIFLRAQDFEFDGDGEVGFDRGLKIEGTVALPSPVADRLVAAAPWMSRLRAPGGALFVPVEIGGTTDQAVVALGSGYAGLLAGAKKGEAVAAPALRPARQLKHDDLAGIPGDPAMLDVP